MKITQAAEYAVRSVLYLAAQPEARMVRVDEIVEVQEIPKEFLKKLLPSLVKAEILSSRRGTDGGFSLDRPPGEISLRMIIEAVEGPIHLSRCLCRKGQCKNDEHCPVHAVWREAQAKVFAVLDGYSVQDMIQGA